MKPVALWAVEVATRFWHLAQPVSARAATDFVAFLRLVALVQGLFLAHAMAQPVAGCPVAPQALSGDALADARNGARDRGFLWRFTKGGHSSYLYGTMHVGRPDWVIPGPALAAAMQASTTLALELDPLDSSVAAQMGTALAGAPTRSLSPSHRARLVRQLEAQCLPAAAVDQAPPELLLSTVSLLLARRYGLDAQFGSEGALASWAHAQSLRVVSLETVALQFNALLPNNQAQGRQALEDSLGELESGRAATELLRLAAMWETGDWQRLNTYEQWCDCVKTPTEKQQMQRLLSERNPAMARQIDALHRSGQRVLVAVGSLHMAGKQGLPALLERKGYTVERLP